MPTWNFVRKSVYHDSVTLMRLTRDLESVPGVRRAAAMMGTPPNRTLLRDVGLLTHEGRIASSNDLVIAIEADDMTAAQAGAAAVEAGLTAGGLATSTAPLADRPRTLHSARQGLAGANLALISVPGFYAAFEAMQALQAGLHVILFSDNVPVEAEIELKRYALAHGLFLMGPDCGSAIINGVPLGFANAVARGQIGLAAASGTGLQEVSCLISAAGEGISQAIGVGGRDLSDEVGGLMMNQALTVLAADPMTTAVAVIGKPPGPSTWRPLQDRIAGLGKPCVVHFTSVAPPDGMSWHMAATLEDAAQAAVALARGAAPMPVEFTRPAHEIRRLVEDTTHLMRPGQRFVRGFYAGGTLAYEARSLLQAKLDHVAAEVRGGGEGHRVVDLGDDIFTIGRPHPMIDGSVRREWILKEAQDPSTAVLLLDVVLGYGAHPDPAGELLPALQQAQRQAQALGRHLGIVASVCGTDRDPQRRSAQIQALESSGVIVMPSNAQAARLAALMAARLQP
jgi:FdrA protein